MFLKLNFINLYLGHIGFWLHLVHHFFVHTTFWHNLSSITKQTGQYGIYIICFMKMCWLVTKQPTWVTKWQPTLQIQFHNGFSSCHSNQNGHNLKHWTSHIIKGLSVSFSQTRVHRIKGGFLFNLLTTLSLVHVRTSSPVNWNNKC